MLFWAFWPSCHIKHFQNPYFIAARFLTPAALSVPLPRVDAQGVNARGRYSPTDLNHGPDMDRYFSVVFHNEKAQREVIRYLAAKEVRCCGHRSHLALDPTADADATIDPHTLVDRCPPPQPSHSPVPQVCPTPAVPSPTAVTITGRRRVIDPSPRIPTLRPIPTAPRCDGAPPPTLSNSHPPPPTPLFLRSSAGAPPPSPGRPPRPPVPWGRSPVLPRGPHLAPAPGPPWMTSVLFRRCQCGTLYGLVGSSHGPTNPSPHQGCGSRVISG